MKQAKNAKKALPYQRDGFDLSAVREGRIESKKVMRVIGNAGGDLNEKFGKGSYTTSFL